MYCESAFLPPLRHVFSCARQPCFTEALVDLISNYFHTKNVTRLWHTLHPIHSLQSRSFLPCSKPTVISAHTSCDVIWWRWSKSNLEEWKTLASAFALMLSALRLLHLNIIPPEISSIHTSSILHSFISVFNENIMFLKAIISLIYHATHWFEKREKRGKATSLSQRWLLFFSFSLAFNKSASAMRRRRDFCFSNFPLFPAFLFTISFFFLPRLTLQHSRAKSQKNLIIEAEERRSWKDFSRNATHKLKIQIFHPFVSRTL